MKFALWLGGIHQLGSTKLKGKNKKTDAVFKNIVNGLLVLAALMLSACQDEEPVMIPQEDILSFFNSEGRAWMTVDVLQAEESDALTRAVGFDDGVNAEHAINSLTLVLFRGDAGTAEDNLTVASSYTLTYAPTTDSHPLVTHHSRHTIQITNNNIRNSDLLYVLAIANVSPTITNGQTFTQVKALTAGYKSGDYFPMSNATLATANNGTGHIFTLVPVDFSAFAPTEAEATRNAATIYLERLAAKVTVTDSTNPKTVIGNTNIDFSTSDIKFGLYNYNDQSYLVRHFNSDWLPYNVNNNYRFVESAPLPNFQYRTYWAEDVNYTGRSGIRTIQSWAEMDASYYCAENTFNVANMSDENTTSVVVRIRVNNANDFYTASVTGSDVIYQLPANSVNEDGTSANESFAPRRSSYVSTAKTIDEYLREWLMENHKGFRDWVNTYASGEPRHVNITVERDERDSGGSGKVRP